VIRLIPPCTDEVRKLHTHAVELQLIYVLKGWIKNEFDGHGQQLMREGTCWLQPPNIKHTVLDYSDDCEMLEIIVPAKFDTVEV
jgi:quercetin dioxygenase-like cupin family protein